MLAAFFVSSIVICAGLVFGFARMRRNARDEDAGPAGPGADAGSGDVRAYVRTTVAGGFVDRKQMRETAFEIAEDNGLEADVAGIEALIDAELARHAEEQATWPESTDCDRLDAAFAALESRGVIARQNFTCCQTCGHAEIGDEIDAAEDESGEAMQGYTFFHQQDTDSAIDGQGLFFAYGATTGREEDSLEVGRMVLDALSEAGLSPHWDGSIATRIHVPMVWRRRRSV